MSIDVMSGTGKVLVLAVGENSVQGSILSTVACSNNTVQVDGGGSLVEKLDDFALLIGKFGSVSSSYFSCSCLILNRL